MGRENSSISLARLGLNFLRTRFETAFLLSQKEKKLSRKEVREFMSQMESLFRQSPESYYGLNPTKAQVDSIKVFTATQAELGTMSGTSRNATIQSFHPNMAVMMGVKTVVYRSFNYGVVVAGQTFVDPKRMSKELFVISGRSPSGIADQMAFALLEASPTSIAELSHLSPNVLGYASERQWPGFVAPDGSRFDIHKATGGGMVSARTYKSLGEVDMDGQTLFLYGTNSNNWRSYEQEKVVGIQPEIVVNPSSV